jgi:hypothetical protein
MAKTYNDTKQLYEAYTALAKASMLMNKAPVAIDYISKAYYQVSQLRDERLRIQCMLVMGDCEVKNNKKIEAFRNYSDALFASEKMDDEELKYAAFDKLAWFYFFLKKYEKAKFYKKKQYDIVLKKGDADSIRLMELNLNLALILYGNEEANLAEPIIRNVIRYSIPQHNILFKKESFKLYRTTLIDNSEFDKLRDLYERLYPEEYAKLSKEDTTMYYRVNGYILEANGKPDSAHLFYRMAEGRLLLKQGGGISRSNFYKRYAEFLLRGGDTKTAIQKLDSAYKYALAANYFPYLIETTHYLDSLNYLQKDVDKAYQFAVLNKYYTEQQAEVNKGEEMLQLEVENEARQQELRAQMEEKETERRHNLQYTGMVIAIISFFILLTLLGTFKVHPGMIRALGFFSFIFFFEFITMIADHRIHDYTHGEPWKFMAFKIVLIAGLLPLHHWLEEKVIHYLVHHHMLDSAKLKMRMPSLKKKEKPMVEEKPSDN